MTTPRSLAAWLDGRERLATLPTPLHRLDRLSTATGRDIWIKRDDLTGLAGGGNKVRKMELLAADARGCDTLVTVGAPQSNHARTVAAAAAVLGLRCELVITGDPPRRATGNLALDALFGARLHFAGQVSWPELQEALDARVAALRGAGARPFAIPVGGSVPLGVLAFAAAYGELAVQCGQAGIVPGTVLHASSTGGTQAGLELGRQLAGDDAEMAGVDVVGVDVARIHDPLAARVSQLWAQAAELLGAVPPDRRPTVLTGYLGAGYAAPTTASTTALQRLARVEGVLADPVYTAKALAALDTEPLREPVVFWHTGGVPATLSDEIGINHDLEVAPCASRVS